MAGKWNIGRRLLAGFTLLVILQMTSSQQAHAEIIAGDPCSPSEEHQFRRTGGPETSGTAYTLICSGSTWTRVMEFDANANVGVKQAIPKAPLHVGGELIVGETTGLDCDADRRGGLRWNDTQQTIEMCDGVTWKWIAGSAVAAGPDRAIQFNNGSALAGASTFIYTSAGLVGIGTNAPNARFHIVDNTAGMLLNIDPSRTTSSSLDNSAAVNLSPVMTATGGTTDIKSGYAFLRVAPVLNNYRHLHGKGIHIAPTFSGITGANQFVPLQIDDAYSGTLININPSRTFTTHQAGHIYAKISPTFIDNNSGNNSPYRLLEVSPSITYGFNLNGVSSFVSISPAFTANGGIDIGLQQVLLRLAPNFTNARHVNAKGIYIDPTYSGVTGNKNFTAFQNTDGNVFLISSAGSQSRVGIGTTSPSSSLKLDIEGAIGATAYCDSDGNNCFNPASGVAAAGPEGAIQFNSSSALTGTGTFVYTSAGAVSITTASASGKGIIVKGSPSQTASLTEWQSSSGTPTLSIKPTGTIRSDVGIITNGGAPGSGGLNIELGFNGYGIGVNHNGETIFLINNQAKVRAGFGVTTSKDQIFGWSSATNVGMTNVVDTGLKRVSPATVTITGGASEGGSLILNSPSAGASPLKIVAATSQSETLTEWRNDSGTVLAYVDKDGKMNAPRYCDTSGDNCFNPASGVAATGPEGAIQFNSGSALAGADTFVYTNAGQVGIGTSSPTSRLHVAGDIRASGFVGNSSSMVLSISGSFVGRNSSNRLAFGVNSPAQSVNLITPHADASSTLSYFRITPSGGDRPVFQIRGIPGQTENLQELQDSGGTILAAFSSAGTLAIGKSTPQTALDVVGDIQYTGEIQDVSDRRLKKEIRPLEDRGSMLNQVHQIKTYSFVMKDSQNNRTEFGVLAQELEEIFPELVRTATDELGTKSVNYIGLIPPLIRAVQEQQTEIRSLRQSNQQLEQQVQTLDRRLRLLEAQTAQ